MFHCCVQEIRVVVRDLEQTAREIQTIMQAIHQAAATEHGLDEACLFSSLALPHTCLDDAFQVQFPQSPRDTLSSSPPSPHTHTTHIHTQGWLMLVTLFVHLLNFSHPPQRLTSSLHFQCSIFFLAFDSSWGRCGSFRFLVTCAVCVVCHYCLQFFV